MQNPFDIENDLRILIEHFYVVANSLKGKKVPNERIKFAEPLAQKAYSHIVSSKSIYNGINFKLSEKFQFNFVDFSSIAVLTRAAFETYLTFNYVFIKAKNEAEKDFRFLSWDLAGFIERESYPYRNQEQKERLEKESQLKDKCSLELEKNTVFQELKETQKKLILKGKWKLNKSWRQLAVDAGFDESTFKLLYSYLSSYAHSGRLSVLQIKEIKEIDREKKFSRMFQTINLMIIARLVVEYKELIPECQESFESNKEAETTAYIWAGIGDFLKM